MYYIVLLYNYYCYSYCIVIIIIYIIITNISIAANNRSRWMEPDQPEGLCTLVYLVCVLPQQTRGAKRNIHGWASQDVTSAAEPRGLPVVCWYEGGARLPGSAAAPSYQTQDTPLCLLLTIRRRRRCTKKVLVRRVCQVTPTGCCVPLKQP